MTDWVQHQKRMAQSWTRGAGAPPMDQAYRLYTLALSGRPEMGAMNRLRESGALDPVSAWQLAAAYQLAGLPQVAGQLLGRAGRGVAPYEQAGWSMGSPLRDRAILLNSLVTLEQRSEAGAVAAEISDALFSDEWHSTHAVSYALLAMARHYGVAAGGDEFTFEPPFRRAGRACGVRHAGLLRAVGQRRDHRRERLRRQYR